METWLSLTCIVLINFKVFAISENDISGLVNFKLVNIFEVKNELETVIDNNNNKDRKQFPIKHPSLPDLGQIDKDLELLFEDTPNENVTNANTSPNIIDIVEFVDVKVSLDEYGQPITESEDDKDLNTKKPLLPEKEVKSNIKNVTSIKNNPKVKTIIEKDIVKYVDVKVSLGEYGQPVTETEDDKDLITKKPCLTEKEVKYTTTIKTVTSIPKIKAITNVKIVIPEEKAVESTKTKDVPVKNVTSIKVVPEVKTIIKKVIPDEVTGKLSPCVKTGEAHKGSNIPDGYPIKELRTNANMCWKMCQEILECEFWTWISDSYNGKNPDFWRGMCYLKRKQSKTPTTITGFIAGTKTCNPFNSTPK